MLTAPFITILAASTAAYAQFALKIVKPLDQGFVQLNLPLSVEIQSPNTTAGTNGPNIQLSLCTEITGLPPCNNTMGTILLSAPFCPPDGTYNVSIPANQPPGLTRLIAGHITSVNGTATLIDETFVEIFLGTGI